jgi:hypothetical protein
VEEHAALEPRLIELPWRSRTLRPRSGTVSTGEPVRRATGSVLRIGPADETQIAEQLGQTRVRIPILFPRPGPDNVAVPVTDRGGETH